MLQLADDDLIARADVFPAVALRDQVDGLGRATDENNFLGIGGAEKFADLLAAGFKQFGRARRERVRGAMDVGIIAAVKLRRRVNHRLRLVRGGGVVEPDERLAVDELVQRGKIAAHALDVELRNRRGSFGI